VTQERPDAASIANALQSVLRDELGLSDVTFRKSPELLAEGVSARAFALELADASFPPLVLRIFLSNDERLPADQTRIESAVQTALADLGYPVPRVFATGDEGSPLGGPFILMERAPGRNAMAPLILTSSLLVIVGLMASWVPLLVALPAYWLFTVRLLGRLHDVPIDEIRERLGSQGVDPERLTSARLVDAMEAWLDADDRRDLQPLFDWLRKRAPSTEEGQVLCHGDFWFGNLMLAAGRVTVIDWTEARISHPEFDLGWIRNQHLSRLPIEFPISDVAYDRLFALIRPFSRVAFSTNGLLYRLLRRVDAERLRHYTVLNAALVYCGVLARRARCDAEEARRDPLLLAWGSPATGRLLRRRLSRLTGIEMPV
jgi:aminoglycoside phosphotransferase (APT) family kinase protein